MTPIAFPVRPLAAPPAARPLTFKVKGRTVRALRKLRDSLFRQGNHELALKAALEIARRDPGRESLFKVGFLSREVGRYREALRALRDALRFEEGSAYLVPEIHLHLAFTWFLLGNRKRMGESLRRAYALRPKPRTACAFHLTLGAEHFAKKRWREALAEYARAEAAAPSPIHRGRAAMNQGAALIRMGRRGEARAHLDRALATLKRKCYKAELATARLFRSALYIDEGQFRRALGLALHAARTFRNVGSPGRECEALQNAGYAAVKMGVWARSRVLLERAVSLAVSVRRSEIAARAYACQAIASAHLEEFEKADAELGRAKQLLGRRHDWVGALHLLRARASLARLFENWTEVRRWAWSAERLAKKQSDLPRMIEFRRMRAEAEKRLGRHRAAQFARKGVGRLEAVLGPSSAMTETVKLAKRLAATELPVLIVGETGTGKLEVAAELHRSGSRAKGPYVVVPCEHLVFPASDLEGHEPGAWSGADRGSRGMVRQAVGGTLVLDGVDLLTPEDQRALVRLVEKRLRPVGSASEEAVDVRVVATCDSLDKLIPDLRQRLGGAVLRTRPLRDRRDDIPRLVQDYLGGRRKITGDALAELASRHWEGNVPELRSAVDRLVAFSDRTIGRKLVRQHFTTTKSRPVIRSVDKKRRPRALAVALA